MEKMGKICLGVFSDLILLWSVVLLEQNRILSPGINRIINLAVLFLLGDLTRIKRKRIECNAGMNRIINLAVLFLLGDLTRIKRKRIFIIACKSIWRLWKY